MRAVSLSNPRVVETLNSRFIPVFTSNEEFRDGGSAPAEERALLREIHKQGHARKLSVGTVHGFAIAPDGTLMDSLHTVDVAKPDRLLAMLEKVAGSLNTAPGQPALPAAKPAPPVCAPDALLLHLTARYLERRGGELALVENAGGNWSALPSEDWIEVPAAEWKKLIPARGAKPGATWDAGTGLATRLLTHFFPPTENSDITKNRIERQSLTATLVSRQNGRALVRLNAGLKMGHDFYHKPDGRYVEAEAVGYAWVDEKAGRVLSLRMATEKADYYRPDGKSADPYGVVVRSVAR